MGMKDMNVGDVGIWCWGGHGDIGDKGVVVMWDMRTSGWGT